jgi:outer membrane protein OmpA-like peptidoglycan-associated protein
MARTRPTLACLTLGLGLVAAGALGLASPARAQSAALRSGGMDLHLFRPALDSKGILSVNGSDILGAGDYSFGLIIDAGFGLVPFDGFANRSACMYTPTGQSEFTGADCGNVRRSRLIDTSFAGTLHFNYGIGNLLVVGVQLPIVVLSSANVTVPGVWNDPTRAGSTPDGLNHQGLGNITLHGKLRLLRAERGGVGLAALLNLELPTGDASVFAAEPGFTIWPQVALELRPIRPIRFAFNLGSRIQFGEGASFPIGGRTIPMGSNATNPMFDPAQLGSGFRYGPLLTFGAGASFRVAPPLDLVAEIYGNQVLTSFGEAGALSTEAIGGLKIFVERNSYLLLAGGAGFLGGWSSANWRATIGFIFEPSIGDRDGDGLKDDVDQCPDEPEDFDNFADEDGCPEPDNDRDGILDEDDECPLVPEDRDGDADDDGCPEGNEGDRDGDGILDAVDQCPDDPEDRDGFQDQDGCPELDNDRDGILDADDLCPNDPEDRDGFQDEDGCPDPDNDNDRILDRDDRCPNDPETYNGVDDQDGCPDRGSVIIEENQIVILEKIYFETDSAVIQQRSFPIIDAVAATLNGNPQIQLIEIQGHADERSSDEYNIRLTRDRAASVLEALAQRGVARDRMRSAGYGERCPVDPRHNPAAWEANRRVEFKILRTDQGPTGVEVACPAGRELIPR